MKIFLYLEKCEPGPCDEAQRLLEKAKEYEEEFEAAMSDDFNTALATSSMFGLAKGNKYLLSSSNR